MGNTQFSRRCRACIPVQLDEPWSGDSATQDAELCKSADSHTAFEGEAGAVHDKDAISDHGSEGESLNCDDLHECDQSHAAENHLPIAPVSPAPSNEEKQHEVRQPLTDSPDPECDQSHAAENHLPISPVSPAPSNEEKQHEVRQPLTDSPDPECDRSQAAENPLPIAPVSPAPSNEEKQHEVRQPLTDSPDPRRDVISPMNSDASPCSGPSPKKAKTSQSSLTCGGCLAGLGAGSGKALLPSDMGAYLVFRSESNGLMSIIYSRSNVPNALAVAKPKKKIPDFKFSRDKGWELTRNINGDKDKYYLGWVMFVKACAPYDCHVTDLGLQGEHAPLPACLAMWKEEGAAVMRAKPGVPFHVSDFQLVAAVHRDTDTFDVHSISRDQFEQKAKHASGEVTSLQ